MKKILLIISFVIISISASWAAKGQLNAYAYGTTMTYFSQTQQLVVSWSLQADASSVKVVAKDLAENEYLLKDFGHLSAGAYQNRYIELTPLIDAGLPMNKDLKVIIKVETEDRDGHEPLGLKTTEGNNNVIHSPFSIDIDDNPESYFCGLMYVTQMRNGVERGIYVYDQWMALKNKQIDPDVEPTDDWYYSTRGVPHMVRAFPDGSGKLLVSSSDREQSTHIWLVDTKESVAAIPVLTDWKPLITSAQLATWTGEPSTTIFANACIDIRDNGSSWDILIYATTVEPKSSSNPTKNHDAGRVYSGVYSVPKTNDGLLGGTYTPLTAYDRSSSTSHEYVSNAYTSSMLSATANFDKFGGVLYNASSEDSYNNPEASVFIHKTLDGDFSTDYVDDVFLMRKNARTKGVRFNRDFSKLAIAQGALNNELRIYDVIQEDGNSHVKLSNGISVDLITGHSAEAYIHDIAWDLAQNIYACVRNAGSLYGIYVVATDLDKAPVCTPIRGTLNLFYPDPAEPIYTDNNLNPYAFGLTSKLSEDQSFLTVNYRLNNSKATKVDVVIYNGPKVVDVFAGTTNLGKNTVKIPTHSFPTGVELTWAVIVNGNSVAAPTREEKIYSFYHPSGLDIDVNPENETFGLLLVNEGMQSVASKTEGYVSAGFGAGIFAFTPSFDLVANGDKPGYNGGIEFTNTRADGTGTAYAPRRIRISEDGRIFVTSLNTDGNYLWEVNPNDMNLWTPIFKGTLNNQRELVDSENNFVAAPNSGFDVKGSGENLQLAMYSVNLSGITSDAMSGFRLHEYNLGTATEWTTAPTKTLVEGKYAINYTGTQVEYDNEGGYWIASYRGTATDANPGLVHINAEGVEDCKRVWNNVRAAGIRFNKDFTKLVVAGNNGTAKKATIYTISKDANGAPVLTQETVVDMADVGNNLNDFAWDYAGNLYACGNSSEKLAAWAMPYSGQVETPAASKYSFEITKPNYDNPEDYLAPFAYDLRRTVEPDGRVKLSFMLNAHARKVQVYLIDDATKQEILLRDYPNEKSEYKDFVPYHSHGYGTVITTEDVDTLGLEYGKNYSWRVDVYGGDVANPTYVKSYSLYHPTTLDIDNNPNNRNFGLILTNETLQEVKDKSGYLGSGFGAGVFAFSADFNPIANGLKPGYNGGNIFTYKRADNSSVSAHAPCRIRISKDGRIFVTSLNTNGDVLWEIDSANLDNWTPVFQGLTQDRYKDLYNGSTFVAGPNAGFDVRGSGDDLQLLMLSANTQTYGYGQRGFRVSQYDLGKRKTWNAAPSYPFPHENVSHKDGNQSYFIVPAQSQVQYDGDGGVWYIQHRSGSTDNLPGLVYFDSQGNEKYKWLRNYTYNAGFRFNHDFSKVIIAGDGRTANPTMATIYNVSKNASGVPVLTVDAVLDLSEVGSTSGSDFCDFAWDYAGNLYTCSDEGEKIAAYVMPRSKNDVVSTPARDEFVVNLTEPVPCIVAYNLTYKLNDATKKYDFSFYANTQPTSAVIRFYKNSNPKTVLYTHTIPSPIKGINTVSIPMVTLDEQLNNEYDITWEVELSAPESQVFGKIYKSGELNTAYATIDNNPESDYFGQIYAANQQNHPFTNSSSGGNVYVWAPGSSGTDIYHTTKEAFLPTLPSGQNGLSQAFRPCVAPDGKVYLTDNGVNGGLYVLDPKNYTTTSFFDGCTQGEKSRWLAGDQHVGSPSSGAHIYWTGGNTAKLFLTRTECYEQSNIGSAGSTMSRHNEGYFTYQLTKTEDQWQHNWQGDRTMVQVNDDNLYQTDFAIVGSSRGAWLCQHRYNDEDVWEARSLMFFDNNGKRQYCSDDDDIIYGSSGAALAVNKDETILAMASGNGGIMFFDINWNGNIPRLAHKYTAALNGNKVVTSLNFDFAGNLVATVGDTYDDRTDKHRMVVFTMPKANNTITVPARFNQRVASLYADEREEVHFDKVETNAYQTVDVYRPLVAGMYNTICLPFSLSTLEGTPYQGATVMKFTNATYDDAQQVMNFNFTKVSFQGADILEAGVPYLIQPAKDIEGVVRFTSVGRNTNFANKGLSVTNNTVTFHGTINPKDLAVNANYLFLVANNRLATASEGGEMLGLRGYFTVNGALPSKAVISFREGTATGVTSTIGQTDSVQKILQDQQILILKGDETYSILGTRVK